MTGKTKCPWEEEEEDERRTLLKNSPANVKHRKRLKDANGDERKYTLVEYLFLTETEIM